VAEAISVVGWDRYQHYSDRDPTWVKLYRDLLTSESWVLGTDTSRLVQVASILLAARYKNKIPLEWRLIRKVANLDCNEDDFKSALSHLVSTNFLEIQSVTETGNAVVHRASTALEQRREERKEEKSREEKILVAERPSENGHAPGDLEFESFRALYPKRNGSNPWTKARKAINARLAEGASWVEILDGASRYALWCKATGKANTEHVMQAARFCGPDREYRLDWTLPNTKAEVRLSSNLDAAAEFMRRTESVQ
jgi:hypothetical protein